MPREFNPHKCNRSQVADALGVDRSTVDRWRAEGCRWQQEGRGVVFDLVDVYQHITRPREVGGEPGEMLDAVQEQARLNRAKAIGQEMANEQKAGTLVEAARVAEVFAPFGREIRQRLLSLGSVIGPRVGKNVTEQRRIKAAVDVETKKALKALSEYEVSSTTENTK